jgi:hypothetical protein
MCEEINDLVLIRSQLLLKVGTIVSGQMMSIQIGPPITTDGRNFLTTLMTSIVDSSKRRMDVSVSIIEWGENVLPASLLCQGLSMSYVR